MAISCLIKNRIVVNLIVFLFLLFAVLASSPATAQVVGATVSGTVADASGSIIVGAHISIKNKDTGLERVLTTDSAGFYAAPNLLPGTYQITAAAKGFSNEARSNVVLTVGAQQLINFSMKVGSSVETIDVVETAPTVDLSSGTLSAEVSGETVRDLPLNGRDWTQLANLQPGINTVVVQASTASATANRASRGFGNQLTDSGHSPYENNYRVNGISINDYTNGSPGSVIGASLGVDAIKEFSVITTDYTAEYGRTSGAIINSITKSGTNDFHGTGFGFLRNADLDAKNYFDSKTNPIPPFHRYQFGGAIGGPIIKNKTFFFAAYEGVRQDQSSTVQIIVPSAAARAGTLCSIPVLSGPGACATTQVNVSPAVAPYLAFWPTAPASAVTSPNGDTQTFSTNGVLHLNENYATVRIDHQFSPSDTLAGSWFYDRGPYSEPDALLNVTSELFSSREMASLEETHVFSPTLVNTFRLGLNRTDGISGGPGQALTPVAGDLSLGAVPGMAAPIIAGAGLTTTSSLGSASQVFLVQNSYQLYDDAFLIHGKHTLKFGFSFEDIQFNDLSAKSPTGQFSFSGLQSFLEDTPTSVQELAPQSSKEVGSRQKLFGFYVQDVWLVRPHFAVSAGVRYEPTTLPTEANNGFLILTALTNSTLTPVRSLWAHNPTLKNFEPRFGFSWDPIGNGKTAIRAGFGLFDVLPLPWIYTAVNANAYPFLTLASANNLVQGDFPIVKSTSLTLPSALGVLYVDQDPPTSYTMNWNANIQREITPNLSLTVAYVGSRSVHMPDLIDNSNYQLPTSTPAGYLFPASSVPKLNPNFGAIRSRFFNNDAWYNGLQIGATKKLSRGFQFQGSYTWGKCLDTGSNLEPNDPFQNSLPDYNYYAHSTTKGLCDYNVSQNGVLSLIWSIPSGSRSSGVTSRILGGWQVGTILTAQSGTPFTPVMNGDPFNRASGDANVDYVSRLSGCNPINSNYKSNGLQYLNLNCLSPPTAPSSMASLCTPGSFPNASAAPAGQVYCANLFGNNGRNQIVGSGLFDLDFATFKNVDITERVRVQFRAEFFNVLNDANFLVPFMNEAIFNANGSLVPNAGKLSATSTTSRQIQFGMKVTF